MAHPRMTLIKKRHGRGQARMQADKPRRVDITTLKTKAGNLFHEIFSPEFQALSFEEMREKMKDPSLIWLMHTFLPTLRKTVDLVREKQGLQRMQNTEQFDSWLFARTVLRSVLLHRFPVEIFGTTETILEIRVKEAASGVLAHLEDLRRQTLVKFSSKNHVQWGELMVVMDRFVKALADRQVKQQRIQVNRLKRSLEYVYTVEEIIPHNNPDFKRQRLVLGKKKRFYWRDFMLWRGSETVEQMESVLMAKGFSPVPADRDPIPEGERSSVFDGRPDEYTPGMTTDQLCYELMLNPTMQQCGWNLNEPMSIFRKIEVARDKLQFGNISDELSTTPRVFVETVPFLRFIVRSTVNMLSNKTQLQKTFDLEWSNSEVERRLQEGDYAPRLCCMLVRTLVQIGRNCVRDMSHKVQLVSSHTHVKIKKFEAMQQQEVTSATAKQQEIDRIASGWRRLEERMDTMREDEASDVLVMAMHFMLRVLRKVGRWFRTVKVQSVALKTTEEGVEYIEGHFRNHLQTRPGFQEGNVRWIKTAARAVFGEGWRQAVAGNLEEGVYRVLNRAMMDLVSGVTYPLKSNVPGIMQYDVMRLRDLRANFRTDCLSAAMMGMATRRLDTMRLEEGFRNALKDRLAQFFNEFCMTDKVETAYPENEDMEMQRVLLLQHLDVYVTLEEKRVIQMDVGELFAFCPMVWKASQASVAKKWMEVIQMPQRPCLGQMQMGRFAVREIYPRIFCNALKMWGMASIKRKMAGKWCSEILCNHFI